MKYDNDEKTNNISPEVEDALKGRSARNKWLRYVVTTLAAIVVFVTTYALILPALTMDNDSAAICGMVDHTHTEKCYSEDGTLICSLPEHEHDMGCFTDREPVVHYECGFSYEHIHTDDCYVNGELCCTLAEHTHTDDCVLHWLVGDVSAETDNFLVNATVDKKTLPEGAVLEARDVTPDGSFIKADGERNLGIELYFVDKDGDRVVPAREIDFNVTSKNAVLSDSFKLMKIDRNGAEETKNASRVSDSSFSFREYDTAYYIINVENSPEIENVSDMPTVKTLVSEGNGYTVTVQYGDECEIPDGVTLQATEYAEGTFEYNNYLAASRKVIGADELYSSRIFDISLLCGEEEIEPKKPVQITIETSNPLLSSDEEKLCIIHFSEDSDAEVIEEADINDDSTLLTYEQAGFSYVAITTVADSFSGPYTGTNEYTTHSNSILDNNSIIDTFDDANEWQIVSGKYHGNSVAEKIDVSSNLRAQKNIIPTGVENEFLIYLSLDIDFENIITSTVTSSSTGIVFETNNSENANGQSGHSRQCQEAWDTGSTNSCYPVYGEPNAAISATNEWTLAFIFNENGVQQRVEVKRYGKQTNSYNNGYVSMYLGDGWYHVGTSAKQKASSTFEIRLTDEMVERVLAHLSDVQIGVMQDSMGSSSVGGQAFEMTEGIFATEIVASAIKGQLVTGNASISEDGKSINWAPHVSSLNYTQASASGWFENVAELVYKIKYVVPTSVGMTDGGTSIESYVAAQVPTNSNTSIGYTTTDISGTVSTNTLQLTSPVITGLHYGIEAEKTDDNGTPLAGASFEIYTKDGGVKTVAGTTVSASDGKVLFEGLQTGTYYFRETAAPGGYAKDDRRYGIRSLYPLLYRKLPKLLPHEYGFRKSRGTGRRSVGSYVDYNPHNRSERICASRSSSFHRRQRNAVVYYNGYRNYDPVSDGFGNIPCKQKKRGKIKPFYKVHSEREKSEKTRLPKTA